MKYNILKFVRNAEDAYSATVSATFDDLEGAKVNYHQTLAALHNAKDVKTATVKIEDEFGRQLSGFMEIVNHEGANS
jgi:hypothetical protein